MITRTRLLKLEALVEELAPRETNDERLDAEFHAVLNRWWQAVPAERREAVAAVFREHSAAVRADEAAIGSPPALLKWVNWLGFPHGAIFPDPIPVALLDGYLNNPDACAGGFQCRDCAVMMPTTRASGEVGTPSFKFDAPVFQVCPCCSGPVGWFAFDNIHGLNRDTLPQLGPELRAGRDPIATFKRPGT